mmetsp:Transcript_94929/g.167584  ORF Transcript_94929/g.167584 Transcript_94929/m.167584 type:complete len:437 (-) Transcript_94929:27-1337(-)
MGSSLGCGAKKICEPRSSRRKQGSGRIPPSPAEQAKPKPKQEDLRLVETADTRAPEPSGSLLLALSVGWAIVSWVIIRLCIQWLPDWVTNSQIWALPLLCLFWRQRLQLHVQGAISAEASAAAAPQRALPSGAESATGGEHRSRAEVEEEVYGSADAVDAKVEHLIARVKAEQPPRDHAKLKQSGWLDCSKKTARVFMAARPQRPGEPFPRIVVCIQCRTQDQVPSLPLIQAREGRISGGAVPIYLSVEHWPIWFPFCDSCELLNRISPSRAVWRMRFKVVGLSIEMIVLVVFNDLLDTEGCIEVLMTSPPYGMNGRRWLGTVMPEARSRFQNECVSFRLAGFPTSEEHCDVEFQCEQYDLAKEGLTRLIIWVWQFLSTRVTGTIVWMQRRFLGSALDEDYNGEEEIQRGIRNVILNLHEHMLRHLQKDSQVNSPD